mmetsp:Transcript_2667/g.8571  ORF Transcript_2667/g.8571 Transcript_2667/m.8571 type:complete len:213 (-) Transcript_2667:456-1094(-)
MPPSSITISMRRISSSLGVTIIATDTFRLSPRLCVSTDDSAREFIVGRASASSFAGAAMVLSGLAAAAAASAPGSSPAPPALARSPGAPASLPPPPSLPLSSSSSSSSSKLAPAIVLAAAAAGLFFSSCARISSSYFRRDCVHTLKMVAHAFARHCSVAVSFSSHITRTRPLTISLVEMASLTTSSSDISRTTADAASRKFIFAPSSRLSVA